MSILITGSEGFLGRNLIRFFEQKGIQYSSMGIKTLDRNNHHKLSSVTEYKEIKNALSIIRPNLLIHLAGSPLGDRNEQMKINFDFSKALVRSLKELDLLNTKIVLMGTSAEYGIVDKSVLPILEINATDPISDYGKSKLYQTNFFLSGQADPLKFIIIRPFNIYGPGMPAYLSISNFVNQIKLMDSNNSSEQQTLEVGNLNVKRDFLYIDDFIQILWELSQNKNAYNAVYNVCSGDPLSLSKIVDYLILISGEKIAIEQKVERMRDNDMPIHYGSNEKVLTMIKRKEFTNWKIGLQRMFNES